MADFDTLEKSIQDAQPIELYTFQLPIGTFRLTSAAYAVTFGGVTYQVAQLRRGNSNTTSLGSAREMQIEINVDHPMVQHLLANGLPPFDAQLTIQKIHVAQIADGVGARQVWRGFITGISTNEQYARIRVPDATDDDFKVHLPIATSQPLCNHQFNDAGCFALGSIFVSSLRQVVDISDSGTVITLDSVGGVIDGHFTHGALTGPNGEPRSIEDQTGVVIIIDVPFPNLSIGDMVTMLPGCDHTVDTCVSKFANIKRFGGHPEMPESNPTVPGGLGVIVQV